MNQRLNKEGYPDPTAYHGTQKVIKDEQEIDKRAYDLIRVLKYIIAHADFELTGRIQLKDIKSGREYR